MAEKRKYRYFKREDSDLIYKVLKNAESERFIFLSEYESRGKSKTFKSTYQISLQDFLDRVERGWYTELSKKEVETLIEEAKKKYKESKEKKETKENAH